MRANAFGGVNGIELFRAVELAHSRTGLEIDADMVATRLAAMQHRALEPLLHLPMPRVALSLFVRLGLVEAE